MIRTAEREAAGCYQHCAFCRLAIHKGDLCVHLRRTDNRRSGLATMCIACAEAITYAIEPTPA